jgi:hypothetical protein
MVGLVVQPGVVVQDIDAAEVALDACEQLALLGPGPSIGLVLTIMVGSTVNNRQGLGRLSATNAGLAIDPRLSRWTGIYPTWEGVGAQAAALLIGFGSYALTRQLQHRRRRRRTAGAPALAAD